MTTGKLEMACHVNRIEGLAQLRHQDYGVVYLAGGDDAMVAAQIALLPAEPALLGLSLDYPLGRDPRISGAALADNELWDFLLSRLERFAVIARQHKRRISTLGFHGFLSMDAGDDERSTQVLARAALSFDSQLSLAVPAGSRGIGVAHHCGVRVVREAWVNMPSRIYLDCSGTPRVARIDRYRQMLA